MLDPAQDSSTAEVGVGLVVLALGTIAVAARVLQDDWLPWRVLAAVATLILVGAVVERARLLIGRVRR